MLKAQVEHLEQMIVDIDSHVAEGIVKLSEDPEADPTETRENLRTHYIEQLALIKDEKENGEKLYEDMKRDIEETGNFFAVKHDDYKSMAERHIFRIGWVYHSEL